MTTATERPAPYAVGQRPSVRIDTHQMSADLQLLMGQHGGLSDAVRAAVRHTAAAIRQATSAVRRPVGRLIRDGMATRMRTGTTTTATTDQEYRASIRTAIGWHTDALSDASDSHDVAFRLAELAELITAYGTTHGITPNDIATAVTTHRTHSGHYTSRTLWHRPTDTTTPQETR